MLVIRHEQVEVLSAGILKGFEDRMVGYLAKRFSDSCAAKGEQAVRETIRKGIERARSYEITTEYDIARYIILMHLFSEDFDTSPATPWAAEILANANLSSFAKMNLLWENTGNR